MTMPILTMSLACTSALLVLGGTMSVAEALPIEHAAISSHLDGNVEQVSYAKHRKMHSTHHNAPNKYCRSQPSRC